MPAGRCRRAGRRCAGRRRASNMRRAPRAADRCSRAAHGAGAARSWAYVVMRLGITVGNFVPKTYVQQVVENSDFRKYDDGLRMILDCTPELDAALTRAPGARGVRRHRALWLAPAGRRDDDLLHAVGDAQRPRPFHRRRPRRLRLGRDRAEGDGGLRAVRLYGAASAHRGHAASRSRRRRARRRSLRREACPVPASEMLLA